MRRGLLVVVACFALSALPALARAQTAAQLLADGEKLYNESLFEPARAKFTQVVSSKGQVTLEQKVSAYKFLGASYAVLGVKDSARSYFQYALDNDPFTDLDPRKFGPDEQLAFGEAKKALFKAGVHEVTQANQKVIDPQSTSADQSTYYFGVATTHLAHLKVELYHRASQNTEVLYDGSNEGARDVPWHGLILAQRADTGVYELRVTATDQLSLSNPVVDKQTTLFRIDHVVNPLEDSLPPLTVADTLISRRGRLAPLWDFGKGALVASLAATLPAVILDRNQLPNWSTHAGVGIGIGLTSGGIAAWYGARHPDNPAAVSENARRRRQHDAFNARVRNDNAARRNRTMLWIRPLTGGAGG